MSDLTIAEVNTLTGDDIAYWLGNPFMDADMLAAKVCWWVTRAIEADRATHATTTATPATAHDERTADE